MAGNGYRRMAAKLYGRGWYGGTTARGRLGPRSTGRNEPGGLVTETRLGNRLGLLEEVTVGDKNGAGDLYDLRGAGADERRGRKSAASSTE
jgi:hypothetical protein